MPDILRVAAMVLALGVVLRAPLRAGESPTLMIRVLDFADAPAVVLTEAQHHVARVFGVAGIKVLWREGSSPMPINAINQVTVLILSDAMTEQKTAKERIPASVLGTAASAPVQRAWIFLHRIEDSAARQGRSAGPVLGHVIVHEVAHMVANIEHSEHGVMSASMPRASDALQGFTDEQIRRLRASIERAPKEVALDARVRTR